MRLRHLVTLNPSKSEAGDLGRYGEVTFAPMETLVEGIGGLDLSQMRSASDLGESNYSYFAEGDLLLAKVTPCFENGKKALVERLPNRIGFATSEVHVIRPDSTRIDPNYLRYLFCSELFRAAGMASMTGAGGLRRISDRAIKDFNLPIAELGAQRAVSEFLDHETARIDWLIRKKQAFYDQLDRRLDSIRDETILGRTHRIPEPKAIDHPFFNTIPNDWSLTPLKYLVDPFRPIMYGIVLPGPNVDDGVIIVKGGDVKRDRLTLGRLSRTTHEIEAGYVRSRLRAGDLVISIRGGIGDVEIVPAEIEGANLTQDAARIAPRSGICGQWLRHALKSPSVFAFLAAGATGAAVRGINIFDLDRTPIPTPPAEEQLDIAARLSAAEEKIDRLKSSTARHIELLGEHRAALISAAVTGELDIRQKAAVIATKSERTRFRVLVGAEIVHRHQVTAKFGRVKHQKLLFLAEAHAGIEELQGRYLREAAGPLDRVLISEAERGMEDAGYFRATATNGDSRGGIAYVPMANAGRHRSELASLIGSRTKALHGIIDLLKDFDTLQSEAVATLYAVWNDALLDGQTPNDDTIVSGVLNDWHPEKKLKFKDADLRHWLSWMKRHDLVPAGRSPRTVSTTTPDLFDDR